jgi:hypothetical protein
MLEGLCHRSWVYWTVKDHLDSHFKNPELKAISVIFYIDACQLLHNLSNRESQPENLIQT